MTRFVVVLDADSTLLQDEVIELIAEEVGRGDEVREATEAAMRGEVDFATSLRSRVAALNGVPVTAFEGIIRRVRATNGAAELISEIHNRGGRAGVVSGGFLEILDHVAPALGVDFWHANRLTHSGGRLTGTVSGDIVDAEAKAATLELWADGLGVPIGHTVAIGDGANDLPMIERSGLGIAFNAKSALRAKANLVVGNVDLREVIPLLPGAPLRARNSHCQ